MDAAFKTAPYPACTTAELQGAIAGGELSAATVALMLGEIARRERAAAGDRSSMTPAERLRFATTGKAR